MVQCRDEKFHVTILNEGSSPGPISLAENEYKCLFCKKTGEYPALVAHVQTHERSAVKHKGYKMYKCHLGCIESGHYHCFCCFHIIIRKNLFINHVQKCASAKVQMTSTEPSRVETCPIKPTNFPTSHSISTVSATCDLISKPITNLGLPPALTSPPVASTSGSSIISSKRIRLVDHGASEMEHFSSTPNSMTGSKTAVLHPTDVMPSDIQNIVSANTTESISTSNKKILKCRPKRTMCCFCNKILNKKNIKTHIQRRHSLSSLDININHHRPSTGIGRKNGNVTVGGPVTGPIAMESVIRDVFRHCIRFPVPISASVVADELVDTASDKRCITVLAKWSQCDLERGVKLRFSQRWTLLCKHDTIELVLPSGTSSHIEKELLSCQSPSGTLQAVIREEAGHQYLEVWGQNGLEKSLDLIALNKHGKVYEDAQFACLAWSPCEKKLLYVAEKKRVEPSAQSSIVSASEDGGLVLLEEQDKNVYVEDWGEGLVGKSCPVLCVADLNKAAVIVYAGVPPNISPGQALWGPNGRGIIFVGQWNEPFRLGLKFCSNRRSALFYLDMKGNCECLSPEGVSVSSPRMSPDSCWIVYLQGQVFGPHHQCLSMMLYDIKNRSTSVLVDVVRRAEKGQFAGIYESLHSQCWSADSERIFFSSACENNKAVFSVDRTTGRLTQVCGLDVLRLDDFGSVQLLTIQKDLMVMSCSSPNQPPCLRVGFLSTVDQAEDMQLCNLGGADVYEEFCWQPMLITPTSQEENHQFSGLNFGAILLKPYSPPERRKTPLVVNIHGGPHAHFAADWNATAAALTKLGFAVLMVNYRGSTGFGQDSIESLLGNVGSQDVKDVQRAVLCALQNETTLDPDRVAVMGGSHGGFLACHLVGQYPDFYRACAARNPVINAATLLGTSDIIDWRYSSVGLQYAFDRLPTSQSLASMLEKSPIIHAAQIRAPVLLMLGGRDRRVSPHQGLELYRALKSRNTPVRLLWYSDEGHSLSKVNTQSDCFLNIVLWFKEHLN
ncbi:S9 family peptidase isoform X2 [Chanodichthys erythropterus]|uniref:S9 family peptidase isoform X2 n=1 Tax=Chanodichthys erythropterus TaxID=933992 RepID=UPI00351EAFD4